MGFHIQAVQSLQNRAHDKKQIQITDQQIQKEILRKIQ